MARATQSEHPIGPESTKLPPIPTPPPTVPASLASSVLPAALPSSTRVSNDEGDEVTCVSTPRPFFDGPRTFLDDDDESTRQYDELPTRVMHLDEGYAKESPPSSGMRASPVPRPSIPRPSSSLMMAAPAPEGPPPPAAPMAYANVVVDQTIVSEPVMPPPAMDTPPAQVAPHTNGDPLASDRALLRAIAAPTQLRVPIVAVRPAPPSPRMLAVVAAFTALGMLWVLAVSAMFLSFLAR